MTGFEVGLGVAKALGPKIGSAAYRRVHPNDWRRRLAKLAASDVGFRVSKRRIRKWLKASETADLIDAFVVSGAAGTSDDAADSLDAELCAGRRWRRLPEPERQTRSQQLVRAVASGLIKAQDPSDAVDVASRRQSAEMRELRNDLAEGWAGERRAEFEAAVAKVPAAARDTLTSLYESASSDTVQRIVLALAAPDAEPTALIPVWVTEPPSWLGDDHAGWTALGVLAEEYLFVQQPVECWTRAVEHGAPRRDYWLMRTAWLLFEQSLPGEDDAALEKARELLGRISAIHDGEAAPVRALRAFLGGREGDVPGIVTDWAPPDIGDRGLQARMLLVVALGAINRGGGSWADVARVAKGAFDADPLPRTGLLLSRAMTQQVYAEPSDRRVELLVAAYDIAVRVRDELRATRAPSLPAVKAAVEAAEMATDERRILRVATDWPEFDGDATEVERKNVAVAQAVVVAALLSGFASKARTHAEALPEGYERSLCLAMCDDLSEAITIEQRRAIWSDVLAQARNTTERLPAWDGLARAGATELPGMREEIGQSKPAVATALEAAAAAARGQHDDAVRMLLPFARADMTAARQLAQIYNDHGDEVNAARTLLDAGRDFHNPDLVTHAAEIFLENGERVAAREAIDGVLADQGSEWAGRPIALRIAARVAAEPNASTSHATCWPRRCDSTPRT